MSIPVSNIQDLFATAHDEGILSQASLKVLAVDDVGQSIQNALGVDVSTIHSSAPMIGSLLVDDSASIRFGSNSQAVRDGHNFCLKALRDSKQGSGILVSCRYINGTQLYPFVPLDRALEMTAANYNPNGSTPLYDAIVENLGGVVLKIQEFANIGSAARSSNWIFTDGHDEFSRRNTIDQARSVITDLLKMETNIVGAVGVKYSQNDDFYRIFCGRSEDEVDRARADGTLELLEPAGGLGIWPRWVLTPNNTQSEIRKAWQVVSQSNVRASQATGAAFSQFAAGGFAAKP